MDLRYIKITQACMAGTIEPLINLWLLRIIISLGGHREFIRESGFSDEAVAKMLGLGHWIDLIGDEFDTDEFDTKAVRKELRELYKIGEKKLGSFTVSSCFAGNIKRLSKLIKLSDVDCRILEFVVLIHNDSLLDDASGLLGELTSVKVCYVLSVILDLPVIEIRASLSAQNILAKSGLVTMDRQNGASSLRTKLDILSEKFADHMQSSDTDPVSLLRDTVSASSPPELKIGDYLHITDDLRVLRPYLRKSIATRRAGVNVFLHGAPGTGKSQLVKVLAEELGCELFEVASENEDGDPLQGEKRLRAFRAAQCFFSSRKSFILFDEVEDVFDDGNYFLGRKSTAQGRKGWMNRMLEENPVPTLWLSNSIYGIDPAFIRRFDMVIELPVPTKKQRLRIINENCADFLSKKVIDRVSEAEMLAPALVTRAASVVRSIHEELGDEGASSAFELIVSNTLETQGHKPIRKNDPNRLPETYDPAYIQADNDIAQITSGLIKTKAGRLCLYGPPGTGKTAYGRWLADQIGVPLLVKRASDLMSMWIGESEKNIARAFKESESDGALLLIDEVDSFLQDRRGAERGWEVSLVNEMLTQIESFSGVFIASTNLMDGLDQAALRRFDLKIKFDFLKIDQAWSLLNSHCQSLGVPEPKNTLRSTVGYLINLTPGDFAAVARRHRFQPIISAEELVSALEAECAVKEGVKRAIGFMQH